MMNNTAQTLESSAPALGPGDRLQAARISIGLTLEDVANRMHLSESILSSLEENNFDDITAPIFVKGYLRAYARIVNVNEEDIIQQYNQFYTEGDPPIMSTSNTAPEINADDARVRWVTWLVIVGLVALLTVWWWNRYQQPAQPLSLESSDQMDSGDSTEQEIRITEAATEQMGSQQAALKKQVQQDLAELVEESSAATLAEPSAVPMDEPVVEPQPLPSPEVEAEIVAEPQPPVAETEDQPAAVAKAELEQAELEADSASSEVGADEGGLVIVVNADTWADIKDADGNKLVRDLLRAGRTVRVDGRAPLQVFLGNGYGVSMRYQGENIDLSSDIRPNNTARIKIGR